jgi:hypothetical protein
MNNSRLCQCHQSIDSIIDQRIDRDPSPHDERDGMVEEEPLEGHHKQLVDIVVKDSEWEESTRQSYHLACSYS